MAGRVHPFFANQSNMKILSILLALVLTSQTLFASHAEIMLKEVDQNHMVYRYRTSGILENGRFSKVQSVKLSFAKINAINLGKFKVQINNQTYIAKLENCQAEGEWYNDYGVRIVCNQKLSDGLTFVNLQLKAKKIQLWNSEEIKTVHKNWDTSIFGPAPDYSYVEILSFLDGSPILSTREDGSHLLIPISVLKNLELKALPPIKVKKWDF
jgi:hypothetical protein